MQGGFFSELSPGAYASTNDVGSLYYHTYGAYNQDLGYYRVGGEPVLIYPTAGLFDTNIHTGASATGSNTIGSPN